MTSRRWGAVAMLPLLALAAGGCGSSECDGPDPSSSASCASVISIAGVTYLGGRGDGAPPVPGTGRELRATRPACECEPATTVRAHSIPGVPVSVAVAGPVADELMLAERFWQVPRGDLPAAVRPHVAR